MKPKALTAGSTIALVSPASPLPESKLEAMLGILDSEGYSVKLMPNALASDEYLAGTDTQRAADLQAAFDDDEVDAVLCTRGGYGCARLLEHLDLDRIAQSGKMFLGFSDITTLHLALNRRGFPTVHSPMAITLSTPRQEWVYESFKRTLRGDNQIPIEAPNAATVVGGVAEGVVTGGCLCLIGDSIGTADSIDCAGKIVLIEDVDENPHRIDAMLTHLRNCGQIQQAAGILIGEMTRTDERVDEGIGGKPWRDIVRDRLGDLGIPLAIDYPFGHAPQMLTLPLGIHARFDADAGTLTYLEPLCA